MSAVALLVTFHQVILLCAGLEGRKVALQRRSSSINRKASTVTELFPSFAETRVKKQSAVLPAIKQPGELAVPLREATAAAKDAVQMQQILIQALHTQWPHHTCQQYIATGLNVNASSSQGCCAHAADPQ